MIAINYTLLMRCVGKTRDAINFCIFCGSWYASMELPFPEVMSYFYRYFIFRLARRWGFQWCLNFNHSTKYTDVINVS